MLLLFAQWMELAFSERISSRGNAAESLTAGIGKDDAISHPTGLNVLFSGKVKLRRLDQRVFNLFNRAAQCRPADAMRQTSIKFSPAFAPMHQLICPFQFWWPAKTTQLLLRDLKHIGEGRTLNTTPADA